MDERIEKGKRRRFIKYLKSKRIPQLIKFIDEGKEFSAKGTPYKSLLNQAKDEIKKYEFDMGEIRK